MEGPTATTMEGPTAYENWNAALRGDPMLGRFEVPLYSDSHFIGESSSDEAPYRLLNLVSGDLSDEVRPRLVLRASYHLMGKVPGPRKDGRYKTDTSRYFGGWFEDEVTALWSLALGVRLIAGNRSREWNQTWATDPLGQPVDHGSVDGTSMKLPRTRVLRRGSQSVGLAAGKELVMKYPRLTPMAAIALVRAAWSYQQGLWVADSDPNLGWLLFISAIETAANQWKRDDGDPVENFRMAHPDLQEALGEEAFRVVAHRFAALSKSTAKFLSFLRTFMPDAPSARPRWPIPWDEAAMKKALQLVYQHRSKALHEGIPFPPPMCEPPRPDAETKVLPERPWGLASHSHDGSWAEKDLPMYLHVFEHITRGALLNWWRSLAIDRPATIPVTP